MKAILLFTIAIMAGVFTIHAQNCPGYSNAVISPDDACGNQIYYLEVENTACAGLIWFDIVGNYGSWGGEITWVVTSVLTGNTIASGGPGTNNAPINVPVGPLDPTVEGQYFTITVYDSYGDGFNGSGFIQIQQGATVFAYQDATWSTDEWAMTFGANIDIYSSTITVTTPSGPVVSTIGNCLDHEVALTLDNTNFCTPITVDLPWTIVCDGTGATLASGTKTVTVWPQIPATSADLVNVTWNAGTCQWDVTPQNDCVQADIGSIFNITPDPGTASPPSACENGSQDFTIDYLGISGGPSCCATGGPLSPVTYNTSADINDAIVMDDPFGGVQSTNNSAMITIPPNGTGNNATSLTLTVDMTGYCFDPPGTSGDDFWVTVYVDGNIIYDQMFTPPPSTFNQTFNLGDIPGGYNENSIVEVFIYPNAWNSGGVFTTYVPGVPCGSLGDGEWTASTFDVTLDVVFDQLEASAANCSFVTPSSYVCCTPSNVTDDSDAVCSGAGTGSLSTWQSSVVAANTSCLVYSSVTPIAGSTPPDNTFPNGVNGGATPINQTVSAYAYCDTDGSGTDNAGDTYTLLSTFTLTVNPVDDPGFTTSPTCDGGTSTITGTTGGTFAFNPLPGDGAMIDANGTVTNGTPGSTYQIQYTTNGICPANATVPVTVYPAEDASFNMTGTCDGGTASITGDTGGTFAFDVPPTDAAVIDPGSGLITGGTSGTSYSVSYTTSGPCPDVQVVQVTATFTDDPSFTMTSNCVGATVTSVVTPGGVFAFNPAPGDGATINPSTGEITNGVAGSTYTIEYTTSGVCSASTTVDITLTLLDDASFTMTPTCDGATVLNAVTSGGTFSFNTAPGDAAVIDAATGAVTGGTSGASYEILYVTSGPCSASSTETVTVYTTPGAPTAGTDATYCSSDVFAPMTASGNGGTFTWYTDAGLTNILGVGSVIAPSEIVGTTVYYVTETMNGCQGPASMVTITIEECGIVIPTAFTPDGDLTNDHWNIMSLDDVYPNNTVMVYNRWGNLLYESDQGDYNGRPWDGTYKSNLLPVGSYYYIIEFNDKNSEKATGTVSIILND